MSDACGQTGAPEAKRGRTIWRRNSSRQSAASTPVTGRETQCPEGVGKPDAQGPREVGWAGHQEVTNWGTTEGFGLSLEADMEQLRALSWGQTRSGQKLQ